MSGHTKLGYTKCKDLFVLLQRNKKISERHINLVLFSSDIEKTLLFVP